VLEGDAMRSIAMAIIIATCPVTEAAGQVRQCSRDQAKKAEATAASLVTWGAILESFRQFGHCDDGAIAEGYSTSVVGMLADRWAQVGDLDRALSTEPQFRTFVLRHINETAGQHEFNRLVANAAVRCPIESTATCQAVLDRARELQRELQRQR
jgi:hypothetical protein